MPFSSSKPEHLPETAKPLPVVGVVVERYPDPIIIAISLSFASLSLRSRRLSAIVIASGDGRDSQYGTSFPGQAERALRQGWNVEVWSWGEQLTNKYNRLCREYPGRIIVKSLTLTFNPSPS